MSGKAGEGKNDADGKRRVVYDAASNTRIVYRVITPGELKNNPPCINTSASSSSSTTTTTTTTTSSSSTTATITTASATRGLGRGRGRRGRPPRTPIIQVRKPSAEETESEDVADDDSINISNMDMSKVRFTPISTLRAAIRSLRSKIAWPMTRISTLWAALRSLRSKIA